MHLQIYHIQFNTYRILAVNRSEVSFWPNPYIANNIGHNYVNRIYNISRYYK